MAGGPDPDDTPGDASVSVDEEEDLVLPDSPSPKEWHRRISQLGGLMRQKKTPLAQKRVEAQRMHRVRWKKRQLAKVSLKSIDRQIAREKQRLRKLGVPEEAIGQDPEDVALGDSPLVPEPDLGPDEN